VGWCSIHWHWHWRFFPRLTAWASRAGATGAYECLHGPYSYWMFASRTAHRSIHDVYILFLGLEIVSISLVDRGRVVSYCIQYSVFNVKSDLFNANSNVSTRLDRMRSTLV
jgi:hypothetical protein